MAFTDVPRVKSPLHIIVLILNILPLPGLGSIIAGANAKHNQTILFGAIQMALAVGLFFVLAPLATVGLIWSIIWGVLIFMKSN